MESNISLKDMERNLFRDSIRDGIIDIQIGLILMNFAFVPLLSEKWGDFWPSTTFLIIWPLVIYGLKAFRKKYIQPRVGKIEYGTYRKKKLTLLNIIILVLNFLALVLGLISFTQSSTLLGWVHTTRLAIILLVGFSLAGYYLDYPRLYGYGFLVALSPIIGEFLYRTYNISHHGFPIMFGFSGTILIIIGLIDLVGIFIKYPISSQGEMA